MAELKAKTELNDSEAKTELKAKTEPLLNTTQERYVVFPIKYHDIWEFYKKQSQLFWFAEEVKHLEVDKNNWKTLDPEAGRILKFILGFFAVSDGIVNENLATRFYEEVKVPEARQFYAIQMAIEAIHAEVYSKLIEALLPEDEQNDVFGAIKTMPIVAKKCEWAQKWIENKDSSFAERLVAFAIVEGIFFSGAFAFIFWFRKHKGDALPGLAKANEFIARDEGIHRDFACLLYRNYIHNKLSQERMEEIIKEAVAIEEEFINKSLNVGLVGINAQMMTQYIHYVSDHLLVYLGHSKIYEASNPFPWMESISLNTMNNFFERFETNYQKSGQMGGDMELMDDF